MKIQQLLFYKIAIVILLVTTYANEINSQCLPDGITFTSQLQIDNFNTNYAGCTEILGNVMIGEV